MKDIKINTLSELTQACKDKIVTDVEAKETFDSLSISTVQGEKIAPQEELAYITGDGNSWTELRTDTNLSREERIEFKKVVGYKKLS